MHLSVKQEDTGSKPVSTASIFGAVVYPEKPLIVAQESGSSNLPRPSDFYIMQGNNSGELTGFISQDRRGSSPAPASNFRE